MVNTGRIYASRFLRTPFNLNLFPESHNIRIINMPSERAIIKNEKILEKALTKLDLLGIGQYLEIDVSEVNTTKEIHIRLTQEYSVTLLKRNIASPYLASYNILNRKTTIKEGLSTDFLFSFYRTRYRAYKAEKAFFNYRSNSLSIKDLPNYINSIYKEYQNKACYTSDESITYSPELFVKTLAMEHIQKKVGFNLPSAASVQYSLSKNNSPKQVTLLNGAAEDWLPYLNENIRLENLAYMFIQTVYNEEGFDRYDRINSIAEAFQLKKEYAYKPEQIIEGGMLPLMWFKELYVNTNIDETMLPNL
jgi:hypothetical protein